MKNLLLIGCLFLSMAWLGSCYNDKADQLYVTPYNGGNSGTCDTTNVTYSGTIAPIFSQNCNVSGCHDAATKAGGYDYSNYNGVVASITSNRLLGAINHASGYFPMPQNTAKLSSCDINKITAWVNKGYQNN
ncbi:MAG: hypothetical protein ACTHJ0_17565 [Flavipsychrobacter sp.]